MFATFGLIYASYFSYVTFMPDEISIKSGYPPVAQESSKATSDSETKKYEGILNEARRQAPKGEKNSYSSKRSGAGSATEAHSGLENNDSKERYKISGTNLDVKEIKQIMVKLSQDINDINRRIEEIYSNENDLENAIKRKPEEILEITLMKSRIESVTTQVNAKIDAVKENTTTILDMNKALLIALCMSIFGALVGCIMNGYMNTRIIKKQQATAPNDATE